jgi:hypothetical protein
VSEIREVKAEQQTTLMLRNLPNNYSRSMFLGMLDSKGFSGVYDFVYLPIDFSSRACLGYAFVNLTDPATVPRFWKTFDGYSKWVLPSRKVCTVSWSGPHQGLEAHIERYRNSPVMHDSVPDEYKPLVFKDGMRMYFPPPTKVNRAPRIRIRNTATHHGHMAGAAGGAAGAPAPTRSRIFGGARASGSGSAGETYGEGIRHPQALGQQSYQQGLPVDPRGGRQTPIQVHMHELLQLQ